MAAASFGVSAEVLSSDFAIALDLVSDVLLNPTFPEKELEREREIHLASIAAQQMICSKAPASPYAANYSAMPPTASIPSSAP